MIFRNPPKLPSPSGMGKYVQADLYSWLENAKAGLNGRLDFNDNFQSFLAKDIEIAAGESVNIPNDLDVIPTERYIVRQTGDGVITDGVWDIDTLRLVNNGSVDVVISVRFFNVPTE